MTAYTGTGDDEFQAGGSGSDSFDYSQGGEDTLIGGPGDDSFNMGAAFSAGDRIKGGLGTDSVTLQGDYSAGLTIARGMLTGVDNLVMHGAFTYRLTLDADAVHGQSIMAFYAWDAGSQLILDASALTNSSVQVLFSGDSGNRVTGGAGRDFFAADSAGFDRSNVIDGGDGYDSFTADFGLDLNAAAHSFQNIESIFLADTSRLVLDDANVAAGSSLSVLTGFGGTYLVDGHKESDAGLVFSGQSASVHFIGGQLGDIMSGSNQVDTLEGGLGGDTLAGGDGADDFVFTRVRDSWHGGADRILDLSADDHIDLSAIDADITLAGQQHFTQVEAFDGHASQVVLSYDAGSGVTHLLGDVDGDGRADLVIDISGDRSDFAGLVL